MELYGTGFRVTCLVFSILMYIIGTVGNLLIIWTITTVKRMRSIQNMLLALLAVIDLLIIGYLMPFGMHVLITNEKPGFGACRFQAIITAFLFSCSIQFIMFIALSRYFKICHSQKFNRIVTARNVIIATIGACVVGACFASALWFFESLWTFEFPMHSCIFDRYGSVTFSVIFMAVVIAFPAGVTAFSYIRIYRHVNKARTQLHKNWNNGLAQRKFKYEQILTKTQFVVFIVYMVMYFPFGITAVGGQRSDYPDVLHTLSIYMCYLNSCINSILYGVLNKNMRRGYLESLRFVKPSQNNSVVPTVSGHLSGGQTTQASTQQG
ncbi:MTNR1A [Mytilus edulis]|uniref:MTNR1A n=1 Tax=Mytilus edulis TaxID=6550 RepID=A0A8S3T8Y1_MYTED|nr:MTNR1A [Mytilus edulis]